MVNFNEYEKELIKYIFEGLTNNEIAKIKNIRVEEVKTKLEELYQKANVSNRLQLIIFFKNNSI